MLAEKRQEAIVDQVNQKGSVLVKELAKQFEVTEDSIRKDLTLLQKKGLLKKTYGGAVRIREKISINELVAHKRVGKNKADKQVIAQKAFSCIEDGDLIYLDLSTCNLELARLLIQSDKNITIVSNMIEILLLYMNSKKRNLIFVGGYLNQQGDAFSGSLTNQRLESFHFDKAFLGLEGVDIKAGEVYNFSAEDGLTKQCVLRRCKKAYMMTETRKFVMEGNYSYARLDDFTTIICEKEPEARIKEKLEQKGLELL